MDFETRDIAAMREEGSLGRFIRMVGGFNRPSRHPSEAVRCPRCGSQPRQRCTTNRGRTLNAGVHPSRIEAHELPEPRLAHRIGAWPVGTKTTELNNAPEARQDRR